MESLLLFSRWLSHRFGFGRWWRALWNNGDLVQHDRCKWLVLVITLYTGNGFHHKNAGLIALAKDGVVLVERVIGQLRDKKLAAICVGTGVGHGETARYVEVQIRVQLIVEAVAGITHACAGRIAAL